MKTSFTINVNVGKERFSDLDLNYYDYETEQRQTPPDEYGLTIDEKYYARLNQSLQGYDEDGSAIYQLDFKAFRTQYAPFPNYEPGGASFYMYEDYNASIKLKLGGWLPNPMPPGFQLIGDITESNSKATGSGYEIQRLYSDAGIFKADCERSTVKDNNGNPLYDYVSCNESTSHLFTLTFDLVGQEYLMNVKRGSGASKLTLMGDHLKLILPSFENVYYYYTSLSYKEMHTVTEIYKPFYLCNYQTSNCSYANVLIFSAAYQYIVPVPDPLHIITFYYAGSQNIFELYKKGSETVSPQGEVKSLFILTDKNYVLPSDDLGIVINSYGSGSANSNVNLKFTLLLGNKTLALSSKSVRTNEAGTASINLKLPSFSELNNYFGNLSNYGDRGLLLINATDSRGISALTTLIFYISGTIVELKPIDLVLPIPDDPWKQNVLGSVKDGYFSNKLEKPLSGDFKLYLRIKEKDTGNIVKYLELESGSYVATADELNLTSGKTYIIAGELLYQDPEYYNWHSLKIDDFGIDLVIPENNQQGIKRVVLKIYVPYSLIIQYYKLASALGGQDDRFYKLLADQAILNIFFELVKKISTGIGNAIGTPEENNVAASITGALLNFYNTTIAHLRPLVALPDPSNLPSGYQTELDFLNLPINYRDPAYNFSSDALYYGTNNYWSKLAKLVILQAELLRTYKYVMNSAIVISKLLALAITLEIFKGYFDTKKFFNKKNIFAEFAKKYGNKISGPLAQYLGAAKISLLELVGFLTSTTSLFGNNFIYNTFKNWFKNSETASIMLALTFKIIRFFFVAIIGKAELFSELKFEVIFQVIATLIAHLLMLLYNGWNSYLLINEIMVYPYISMSLLGFLKIFPVSIDQYGNISFNSLLTSITIGTKPTDEQWSSRNEEHGAIETAALGADMEAQFFSVADAYSNIENAVGIVLALVRALDGIFEKLKRTKFENALAWYNKEFQITFGGKSYNINIKNLVSQLYLSLVAAILTDGLMKGIWGYAIKKFITVNQDIAATLTLVTSTIAPLVAAVVTFFTLGKIVKTPAISKLGFIKAASYQDNDAIRMAYLSNEINRLKFGLNDMMGQSSYRIDLIQNLVADIEEGSVLVQRAIFRSSDANLTSELIGVQSQISASAGFLYSTLSYIITHPSLRPTATIFSNVNDYLDTISSSLSYAANLTDAAYQESKLSTTLGPAIFVKNIFTENFPDTGEMNVIVYNLGDSSASVKLRLLDNGILNSYTTDAITINARSSHIFTLKPTIANNANSTSATIVVNVNDFDAYTVEFDMPLVQQQLYSASNGGVTAISDGPVSFDGSKIKVSNANTLIVYVPSSVAQPRFGATLDGYLIRSGEVKFDDFAILGVSFSNPVTGTIEYKSLKQSTEFLQGMGSKTTQSGVTIESNGNFSAQITKFDENPF
ncbi:MAG TPA: hypothetical protein VKU94_04540, partial [Geobacterales bacterium]|nr:hypothetical protein [Geobacterales bacterium]